MRVKGEVREYADQAAAKTDQAMLGGVILRVLKRVS